MSGSSTFSPDRWVAQDAGGSRDRGLAEAPELRYTSAAELLYVLDALEA